ncbi:MAG: pyridoxamine 5'-phosphate oxidase family protein [Ornithinimicrobium sp.]
MTTPTHPTHDDFDDEGLTKVRSLIKDVRTCMLTSIDRDGGLISRPMAVQEVEFDGDLWFFSEAASPKVANVSADPQVNVAFVNDSVWVSLKGQAEVVDDPGKKEELWNPFVAAWFTHEPADPAIVLIRVHADSAEYWDSPGAVATAISMLKTRISGGTPSVGDNEVVDV